MAVEAFIPDVAMPSIKASTSSSTCLVPATRFVYHGSEFEYSVHAPGSRFSRELATVFPQLTARQRKDLLVIPVIQQCDHDMAGNNDAINKERDVKLELFIQWGKRIADRLRGLGMWADVMDPASGFPIYSEAGPTPYPDVQGTQTLTRYDVQNIGCCHILLHPAWKSKIYPSTFFTTAPHDILVKVINEILAS
ncbi:hypothetical protein DM01DRAFT_1334534 [Hesseltinella vesiculosa]|uniref:Methylmalonic aciduria and homocystinuria type D protein n=1 Tax=Hesseltinella vesiculosa TaxID=101127 RepID=A0A1X2GMA8_9FUNG|nr:hypothetical protein DM01DRAFT_1334534 [Hesseltinella vesiculosa]